jgi:hypothetical protein
MITVATEEMDGPIWVPDLRTDCRIALVGSAHPKLERHDVLFGVLGLLRSKSDGHRRHC